MKLDRLAECVGISNEQITAYMEQHPDEVFGARELYERIGQRMGLNALRLRLARLYEQGVIDRLKHANEYLYGPHKTIEKARKKLAGGIDET